MILSLGVYKGISVEFCYFLFINKSPTDMKLFVINCMLKVHFQ